MAAPDKEGITLSFPRATVVRMLIFLVLVGIAVALLFDQIRMAFMANPGLNGLIVAVLAIGILYTFRQVLSLHREIHWVNSFRRMDPGLTVDVPPILLAPMATMLGERKGRVRLGAFSMRSLLDSIGSRLDEQREISRYIIGLLIFLGLLGTFWGLLGTISSVGSTLQSLDVGASDMSALLQNLRNGLQGPLEGMGTAFSSSLFGLTGSLILGFLDLQAGNAQNRFYNELEEWLSTVTSIVGEQEAPTTMLTETVRQLESIEAKLSEAMGPNTEALHSLVGEIRSLTRELRVEQQSIRRLSEAESTLKPLIERLIREQSERDASARASTDTDSKKSGED